MAGRKKTNDDLFGDETGAADSREDFAALLAQSESPLRKLRAGDSLRGEILSIGKEEAFVSTGTPTDGALPASELRDAKGELKHKVGDVIEVRVVRAREGEIFLRKAGSTAAIADIDSLEDAFDMELPVEGRVTEAVKGGARVQVHGKLAFCPISQLDVRRVESAAEFIGQKYEFLITQFEGGRNIVVSRRKILEQKRAESEVAFIESAKPGDIFRAKITRIERYGAFAALTQEGVEGVEGLIPISEIAWGRIGSPGEVVSIGQEVDVALLRAGEEAGRVRISLSLKQAGGEGDPWARVGQDFPVGAIVEGEIERKEPYGLFVKIAPAITGLLPRSKWRDRVDGAQFENRKKGERIKVQIDEIQSAERKLTLAPPSDVDDGAWRAHAAGAPGAGFGTFADLLKGATKPK